MYIVDFTKPIHIHFIGIGGISMSGLAEILLKEGFRISGSDAKESSLTDHLTQLGADIRYGQRSSNITDDIDLVVYTAAIHPDNPEEVDEKACIFCMRCVSVCSYSARRVDPERLAALSQMLEKVCSTRKDGELFL